MVRSSRSCRAACRAASFIEASNAKAGAHCRGLESVAGQAAGTHRTCRRRGIRARSAPSMRSAARDMRSRSLRRIRVELRSVVLRSRPSSSYGLGHSRAASRDVGAVRQKLILEWRFDAVMRQASVSRQASNAPALRKSDGAARRVLGAAQPAARGRHPFPVALPPGIRADADAEQPRPALYRRQHRAATTTATSCCSARTCRTPGARPSGSTPREPHIALVMWFTEAWAENVTGALAEMRPVAPMLDARRPRHRLLGRRGAERRGRSSRRSRRSPPAERLLPPDAGAGAARDRRRLAVRSPARPPTAGRSRRPTSRASSACSTISTPITASAIAIEALADVAALSPPASTASSAATRELTVGDYVAELRIGQACALLVNGEKPDRPHRRGGRLRQPRQLQPPVPRAEGHDAAGVSAEFCAVGWMRRRFRTRNLSSRAGPGSPRLAMVKLPVP